MSRIPYLAIGCLLSTGLLPAAPLAAQSPPVQAGFPDYAEVEYEHSIITIPIYLGGDREPAEVIKFDAFMRLDREKPVRNGLGYRQFEFTIEAWELYGYSKALGANITFKLSETVKPKSLGVALQKKKDYPAMIVYNAIYDIYLNDVKIGENLAGVAFATGVMEIPPRNTTVAFNKPFILSLDPKKRKSLRGSVSSDRSELEPCDGTPEACMGPGTCEEMTSITAEDFAAGVAKAKSYRTPKPARNNKK
jgi:hypothetical protein